MLALSSGILTLLELAGATLLAAIVIGVVRAATQTFKKRQTDQRQDEYDQRTLTEFFFDTPRDIRTGTPGKTGWTTKVDSTLDELRIGQARTTSLVNEVLRELKPDGNGGHNLRGMIERNAKAAGVEVGKQTTERERVQHRDDVWDAEQ